MNVKAFIWIKCISDSFGRWNLTSSYLIMRWLWVNAREKDEDEKAFTTLSN